MTHHTEHTEEWDRENWKGEGQGGPAPDLASDTDTSAHWHKEQWEGEGQDDLPLDQHPRESHTEMADGDSELSGHGHNPGGGKQFGDVDRTE